MTFPILPTPLMFLNKTQDSFEKKKETTNSLECYPCTSYDRMWLSQHVASSDLLELLRDTDNTHQHWNMDKH